MLNQHIEWFRQDSQNDGVIPLDSCESIFPNPGPGGWIKEDEGDFEIGNFPKFFEINGNHEGIFLK